MSNFPPYYSNPNSVNHLPSHERVPEAERKKAVNKEWNKHQRGEITKDEFDDRRDAIDAKAVTDKESNRQKAQADAVSDNQTAQPSVEPTAKPEDVKASESPPPTATSSTKKSQPAKSGEPKGSWTKQSSLFDGKISGWSGNGDRRELPFMFEVWNPANKDAEKMEYQEVLPFNPESYRMVYTPRANTTLTQGGIYEDNIGIAPPKFIIKGVFGVVGTTVVGAAKSLLKEGHTGMYLYHELEKNLLEFYERFGTSKLDGTKQDKPADLKQPMELRFFNFCDQEYWLVQINQFTLEENIQRRHLYQYDIQMTGLKRLVGGLSEADAFIKTKEAGVTRERIADASKAAADVSAWDSFMQSLQGGVSAITGPLQKAQAAMSKVMGEVNKLKGMMNQISGAVAGFKNGLTSLVHAPFDLVQTALETVRSINKSATDIANLPHEFVHDMREVQRLLQNYSKRPELFSTPVTTTSTSEPTTAESDRRKSTGADRLQEVSTVILSEKITAKTGAIIMDIPEETIFAPDIEQISTVVSKVQNITDSDTIQSIAAANGVDWKQVATLNNIEYPYIAKNAMETMTPTLSTASVPYQIEAGSTTIPESVIAAKAGEVLAVDQGQTQVVVSKVENGTIYLEEPLPQIAADTQITRHAKQLAVLRTGDRVMIPGQTGTSVINIGNDSEDIETKIFGIDEYLIDGRNTVDSDGDIATIKGVANLEMQLMHRITTVRGELAGLGHPEYGSLVPTFIGKISSPVWQERIMVECMMAVMADPRIQSVFNARMVVDNTAILFTADVLPINKMQPLQISVPVA